jgi:hypothetical protein
MTVGELKEELKDIPDEYEIKGHFVATVDNNVNFKESTSVRVRADKDVFHISVIFKGR